ncbi:AAA family ATPase [Oceanobacillus profundus]|uniref:AAA family ATPase n=1 Tax=Oceanobacillus TaxID=182709 RepID=UPI0026E3754D|nr:AAA family ATPase [Oceanobacillus profundus]MDO6447883.1 AAA family ATPase [Oceanobacillus profundus]
MIRTAKVPDIWRKIDKNSYRYYLDSINLNGILGITKPITFQKGIFTICGLNGVGKSTVFTAIKDILGINISNRDRNKIRDIEVTGILKDGNKDIVLKNSEGQRLLDFVSGDFLLECIDFQKLIQVNSFIDQPYFNELIDQHEDNVFDAEDITSLNYIVGKTYDSVVLREIEVEDEKVIPYFQVECNGLKYDSLAMGTGELFLFYIYWVFKRISTYGVLLIEEPEVFISVNSQVNLMNFIADRMDKHRFSVILVTHSPFILKNVSTDRMLIMHNYLDTIDVHKPKSKEEILENLGLIINKKGILIFEDSLGLEFFRSLCKRHAKHYLKYFNLEKTNGFADITKILSIPRLINMNYIIAGIYDGDMRTSRELPRDLLNWEYSFLPGEKSLEEEFQKIARSNFSELSSKLNIEKQELRIILGGIQGSEHHDWLIEITKESHNDFSTVVDIFTQLWEKENSVVVNDFLSSIAELI